MASASMAGFDYNGLVCFDTWLHVANGFGFNNWLRLQWLGFDVWVRAVKWLRLQWLTEWLRLQWLASATMGWL